MRALEDLCSIDPAYIQFGCAEWFWQRQVNSYALQVEPWRYRDKDRTTIQYEEACHLESVRDKVFDRMRGLIHERLIEQGNTS